MTSVTQRAGSGATRDTRAAGPRRRPGWLAAMITMAVVAVCCAACSSSSPATSSGSSGSGSGGGGPASGPAAKALQYTQCMRAHGVHDYPDPGQTGGVSVGASAQAGSGGGSSDLNPNSPVFQAANQACRSFLPGGTPVQQPAKDVTAGVKFANCMRSHGFPTFPDPNSQNTFYIPAGININSASYQSAFSTCQSEYKVSGARYSQDLGAPSS